MSTWVITTSERTETRVEAAEFETKDGLVIFRDVEGQPALTIPSGRLIYAKRL